MDRKVIRSVVWDYIIITVGALLYVVAWTSFLIPNGIASGGLTGACTIIEMATRGLIPVGWSFPALNALLIIIATLILGKGFGFRTIYAILVSTLLFDVMPKVDVLLSLPGHLLYLDEKILVPVIGGIVEAIGIGLILSRGGSTGGTDIFAMIINKFWPVSPGQVYLYFDLFIIASVLLIPGKTFQDMMYGYLAMISFSLVVDYVLLGRKSSVQVLIFSEKFTDIADFIIHEMDRGVTAINAVGWYTQSEKKVLLVLARKSQLHEITKAVKGVDPKAFMSVSPASDVYGEGFEEIKTGIDRKKKA
ncbi:MAG: YitT family protein [Bacteroidales bacterium]|nr:YitT family protein [Bacteroidales bacterium]